ncbi:MAG: hypothetical protein CME19_14595 [Gemmatimonadetes bacterium]|nr:hypothetical protein [Gemmatimonadota bacterium]|tara:strand:- start:302 stop:850 length:549 start_codon:yes stop_codon:yes gene_type:complete
MADPTFKQLTRWFIDTGADQVSHTKNGYLAHAIGVYNDLKKWDLGEDFARAGLFHSIYGTQQFQGFTLPVDRRDEVRDLIGDYYERLCFLNCFMQRETLYSQWADDKQTYSITHREAGEQMEMDRKTYDDLCTLHLCDWLEQVERSGMWDFNREEFHNLGTRLGGIAEASYDTVFAREPSPS